MKADIALQCRCAKEALNHTWGKEFRPVAYPILSDKTPVPDPLSGVVNAPPCTEPRSSTGRHWQALKTSHPTINARENWLKNRYGGFQGSLDRERER